MREDVRKMRVAAWGRGVGSAEKKKERAAPGMARAGKVCWAVVELGESRGYTGGV